MKRTLISVAFVTGSFFLNAQPINKTGPNCELGIEINTNYSKAALLDSIMKSFAPALLPGTAIALYSESEGWWASSQGYANLEKKVPMQKCHLQYIQSISKMYIAVEILQLKERGKIELDVPMTKYLPHRYGKYIKGAEKITIRMLLNHTSGVAEYNTNASFVSQVILHPLNNFSSEDCLRSIDGNEPQFLPGAKYLYTNTNYLLLSLIGDAITGDHAAFIRKNIFDPLGLNNSYYSKGHDYLKNLYLPESYWDVLNIGKPVNVTPFQQVTVVSSKGDDGIVCTTADAVKFLKGLMEGKLLNPESMKEMMNFMKDEKGNNRYGLGMTYFDLGGLPAYGHGGGGVGSGCGLVYIPSHKIYLFISTNLGVFVDSDLSRKADDLRNAILMTLLQ